MKATTLPKPTAEAVAHSQSLLHYLIDKIRENDGKISFHDYMHACLYAPGLGYYAAGSAKFGEAGDFITAPEISPLFAASLARPCEQVLAEINDASILEFGAGSGKLAADLLKQLKHPPAHYYILEISPDLKQRQQVYLQQQVPQFFDRMVWLDQLPEKFSGIVLANEVLDAMPVHRILHHKKKYQEYYVSYAAQQLQWQLGQISENLQPTLAALQNVIPDHHYTTEINLWQAAWIRSLAKHMQQGVVLLIDYGFHATEFFHPQRHMGTLMCHYRQHAHHDPFYYPGLQDITAHVNFTALAESAVHAGFDIEGFTNQASFLLNTGLLDHYAAQPASAACRQLTHPSEMGELFKAIAFSKNFSPTLLGFQAFDQTQRL